MLRLVPNLLRRTSSSSSAPSSSSSSHSFSFFFFNLSATLSFLQTSISSSELFLLQQPQNPNQPPPSRLLRRYSSAPAPSPSLSIWRRKKEIGKEGLIVAKELKRLRSNPLRLDRFIRSHVSRLLKSDLVSVLAEFKRQDQVFLSSTFNSLGGLPTCHINSL